MSNFAPRQSACNLGLLPPADQSSRYLHITVTLAANTIQDDLVLENENGTIETVQTIYVDTSAMSAAVTIKFLESGQSFTLPKQRQAYFPVLCSQQVPYTVTSTGEGTFELFFINVPVPPATWATV